MLQALIGVLVGIGLFFILADLYKLPYWKTSAAVESISKKQKKKTSILEVWLGDLAKFLAKYLKVNEFKRAQLLEDLKSARMDITPELYIAGAIVKALVVGVLAIPVFFLFPMLCPVFLFASVVIYLTERKRVSKQLRLKRSSIEYELPRLVFTIEKTLKHNRDVIGMLDHYTETACPELKQELEITVADMKSGNAEAALNRMDARVGSPKMSDVCRGLTGILRGDETEMYWYTLRQRFADDERQMLRIRAQKIPKKVNRLSMCLLFCFLLTYIVVILEQIVTSLGVLFG